MPREKVTLLDRAKADLKSAKHNMIIAENDDVFMDISAYHYICILIDLADKEYKRIEWMNCYCLLYDKWIIYLIRNLTKYCLYFPILR